MRRARERERAGVGAVEAGEQAQQRALAAAGRPDQADEFAVVDRHVEMVERQHRLAGHRRIDFDDAVRLDQRAGAGDCAGRGRAGCMVMVAVAVIGRSCGGCASVVMLIARVRPPSRSFRSPAPRARSACAARAHRLERAGAEFVHRHPHHRRRDADRGDRIAVDVEHRHREHAQAVAEQRILQRVAALPDRLERALELGLAQRLKRRSRCGAAAVARMRSRSARRQERQDGVADDAARRGNERADADVDAEPRQAGAHPLDIEHVAAVEHAEARRLADLVDQRAQDRPRQFAQVGAADGVQAEIDHLQGQAEALAVRHARDVAQHHQRVEHAERGAGIDAGGARHLAQRHLGAFGAEGFEHAQSLGQRIDEIARVFAGRRRSRPRGARATRTCRRGGAALPRPFSVRWCGRRSTQRFLPCRNPFFGLRKYFCRVRECPIARRCVNRTARRRGMHAVQGTREAPGACLPRRVLG